MDLDALTAELDDSSPTPTSHWRGTTRASAPAASPCRRSTCPPTGSTSGPSTTSVVRPSRWASRHAEEFLDVIGGGDEDVMALVLCQARQRAGRGPPDRLRGRLRRPRRRGGGPGGQAAGEALGAAFDDGERPALHRHPDPQLRAGHPAAGPPDHGALPRGAGAGVPDDFIITLPKVTSPRPGRGDGRWPATTSRRTSAGRGWLGSRSRSRRRSRCWAPRARSRSPG